MIIYQSDIETYDVELEEEMSEFSNRTRDRGVKFRFSDKFETERHINIDGFWNKNVRFSTETGIKQYFFCGLEKDCCPKRGYLLYDNRNDEVHFFHNFLEHDH